MQVALDEALFGPLHVLGFFTFMTKAEGGSWQVSLSVFSQHDLYASHLGGKIIKLEGATPRGISSQGFANSQPNCPGVWNKMKLFGFSLGYFKGCATLCRMSAIRSNVTSCRPIWQSWLSGLHTRPSILQRSLFATSSSLSTQAAS